MNNKLKRILSIGVTLVCAGVFVYAAHGLISTYLDYHNNSKTMDDLQQTFYEGGGFTEWADNDGDELNVRSGFDVLLEENEELVGWITIDGTQIDYPILQSDNNFDYLRHDFHNDYNILGSIFMDFRNDITSLGKNTIVYGHRTKDQSMFEGLTKYEDQAFFEEHQSFTFDTLYDSYEAEIFAVYNTTTDFNYIQTDFANDEDFDALLNKIDGHSLYDTGVDVTADDHILTLSTCDYELDELTGRFVVQAKLTKKDSGAVQAAK
ncbi:class B sortase [Oceanobacillus alkalisoli]|uniref:class B sortase n=1 Tax=Oceanobacillus alkalisoli TaxID=2925113 RepID=UPI001EF03EDB|nr:class B sortase [Oceanobacillus alkalisoli]MCF3943395.1 class B sortase [Oceanobacillus alkalisoli]MCG5103984.1 class B sortase [Oceanobacillus alkalisoli]